MQRQTSRHRQTRWSHNSIWLRRGINMIEFSVFLLRLDWETETGFTWGFQHFGSHSLNFTVHHIIISSIQKKEGEEGCSFCRGLIAKILACHSRYKSKASFLSLICFQLCYPWVTLLDSVTYFFIFMLMIHNYSSLLTQEPLTSLSVLHNCFHDIRRRIHQNF